ncbi:helix-turn-helix domain-containing protein [Kribbella swartbergensis]
MSTADFPDPQVTDGAEVVLRSPELWCRRGPAPTMRQAHRHDDIELNVVTQAPLRYLFGGTPAEIRPGEVGLFWAAMPHRLLDGTDNWRAHVGWVHVPLRMVLGWGLPEAGLAQLLGGRPLVAPVEAAGDLDVTAFDRWSGDFDSGSAERRRIALLEIQAHIRRLLYDVRRTDLSSAEWGGSDDGLRHVAAMARYVMAYFREPITATEVAAAAHLHPNYAMTLFRRVVGTTLGAYLAQCRVAEAQRLLITTNITTTAVAAAAGFGSQSGFYATFTRLCGTSPGAYRRISRFAPHEPGRRE